MTQVKKILAVIPARGGSKRLPRKNIMPLAGKPLIHWAIESGIKCARVDTVVVSTDCQEIARQALEAGADVPFIRPKDLSEDHSSSVDVAMHSLEFYANKDVYFDYILLLQPTSPLRNQEHVSEAIDVLVDKKADAVISVCELEHPIKWTNKLGIDDSMGFFVEALKEGKDDIVDGIEKDYRLNGAIYLVRVEAFLREKTFLVSDNIYAYKMDRESSIDIDVQLDFDIAEMFMNKIVN